MSCLDERRRQLSLQVLPHRALDQHAAAARGARRLPLRLGRVQRRGALLGGGAALGGGILRGFYVTASAVLDSFSPPAAVWLGRCFVDSV